jgi:branched-chain amino acid transport system permease protein
MPAAGPCALAVQLGPDAFWWTSVLVLVGIYALLGLSLNLINGYARMFSLGHHGFWAMGAYAAAWWTLQHREALPDVGVFLASCAFAMAVAAAGGLLIGIPCLRLRGDYLAIATLGFGEIVRIAIQNSDRATLGGSLGLEVPRALMAVTRETRGEFRLLWVGIVVATVALVALLVRNYVRSPRGRAMLATAQDEVAAGLLGINPVRSKVAAFAIGSTLAGLAGALYAHYSGFITPLDFTFMEMVKIFLVVVLGGLGSISGCILAAFLLIYIEQALAVQGSEVVPVLVPRLPAEWTWVKDWWQVEYALILVLLMIFRPRGLLGPRELPEVVRDLARRLLRRRGRARA